MNSLKDCLKINDGNDSEDNYSMKATIKLIYNNNYTYSIHAARF